VFFSACTWGMPPMIPQQGPIGGSMVGPNMGPMRGPMMHPTGGPTTGSALVVFLFLAGLWFTGASINGPNFHPKWNLAAPTLGYSVSCCVSC